MTSSIRVLLLADTHLGYDLALRPRVDRRRRGPDFFDNARRALEPALRGDVDLVVHGGDLLFRSKVPVQLVSMAFEPLLEAADAGIPVFLVPGNHERSAIPYPLLAAHRNLHIFDRPKAFTLQLGGKSVVLAGFPCVRNGIRDTFREKVAETGVTECPSGIRILCLHQTIEGATVGPSDFVFRSGPDIVRGHDLPTDLAAVLSGHIHRAQKISHDLAGRPLPTTVYYPGSVERTSYAERDEVKGYLILEVAASNNGGRVVTSTFHKLPTRPLESLEINSTGRSAEQLEREIREALTCFDDNAVVRVRFTGPPSPKAKHITSAAGLRSLAPRTMTVTAARPGHRRRRG